MYTESSAINHRFTTSITKKTHLMDLNHIQKTTARYIRRWIYLTAAVATVEDSNLFLLLFYLLWVISAYTSPDSSHIDLLHYLSEGSGFYCTTFLWPVHLIKHSTVFFFPGLVREFYSQLNNVMSLTTPDEAFKCSYSMMHCYWLTGTFNIQINGLIIVMWYTSLSLSCNRLTHPCWLQVRTLAV